MAQALNFQSLAETHNALIFLPESPIWELVGQQFHMWDVEDGTSDKDLALFDDLRTCGAQNFDINLDKVVSGGFSGGSLFNTILLGERADHLAAVVEMSGGANIDIPTFDEKIAPYDTPSTDIPILLISGGDTDLWPDASLPIVHFQEATDTLQEKLLEDERFVVRCTHNTGHNITNKAFSAAIDWLAIHEYGVSSTYEEEGIGSWEDWCVVPE
jgi:predicted esterase